MVAAATELNVTARTPPGRSLLRPFLYVFLLSLVIRVLWTANAHITPIGDYFGYDRTARHWVDTGQFCQIPQDRDYRVRSSNVRAYRTPGYIGFVALLYLAFGHNWGIVGAAQAVLGALTSGLVVVLAARTIRRRVGIIAGVLYACWPMAIVYVPVLATDNLLVFLLIAGLTCLTGAHAGRWRWWLATGAGLCFGLMMLTRPSSLFLFPGFALLCLYNPRQRVWRPGVLGLMLVLTAAVLTPWLVRNYRLGLGFPTLSTQGGYSLWWGNNWVTRDGGNPTPPRFPRVAHLPELEQHRFYMRKALEWMWNDRGRYMALCAVRLARLLGTPPDVWGDKYFWPSEENDQLIYANYWKAGCARADIEAGRELERRNRLWEERARIVAAPLMLVAVLLASTRWRDFAFVVLPLWSYVAGLAATVFAGRYRVTSDPLVLICVAALLVDLIWTSRETGRGLARWFKLTLVGLAVTGSIAAYARGWDRSWYQLPPGPAPQPTFDFQKSDVVTLDALLTDQVTTVSSGGCKTRLRSASDGLHVDLHTNGKTSRSPGGGLRVPAVGLRAVRLRLAVVNPRAVDTVVISGVDAAENPLVRWTWKVLRSSPLPAPNAPKTFVLVPGESSDFFVGVVDDPTGRWARLAGNPDDQPVQAMKVARDVRELRIVVRPKPGQDVSLLLHELTLAVTSPSDTAAETPLQHTEPTPKEDEDAR